MMKPIFFISKNSKKVSDMALLFKNSPISIKGKALNVTEIQSLDQKEIALLKAKEAWEQVKEPVIIDDTGFYIKKFGDFPGTMTKFVNKSLGIDNIIKLIDEGELAHFRTILVYFDGAKEIISEGIVEGKLTKKVSENFNPHAPLNSIFIPEGYDAPVADLSESEVNNLHRVRAAQHFITQFTNLKK